MYRLSRSALTLVFVLFAAVVSATPYTENVPAPTSLPLPPEYPAAGGVVIVLTGANGNVYYQFSDPTGAFRGFNNNGQPAAFRGNPFTVNDPIQLDCGFAGCATYFGGSIARMDVRFSAWDGDTQPGGFDENDINLFINGFDVGSWSNITTEATNTAGNVSFGFATGFGNNTFNTAWFSSTNSALLNNILTTNQTVSQVFDDDPNDNYWDFRRGSNLANPDIETIAPGYTLEKTVDGGATTYTQVGEVITYNYIVSNIGSVDIDNVSVVDDKIGAVTCSPTSLPLTEFGAPSPNSANCSATYTVTQEDLDAGELTNIAQATGDPEFGTLGPLTDTVTMTGPALVSTMTLEKEATPTSFSAAGETITYDFTVTNTGNSTLSNVAVTDPRIPSLSCSVATLLPAVPPATPGPANQLTCSGTYVTTQADVDNFINSGQALDNTATAAATDPNDVSLTETDMESLDGPVADPTFTITKTATPTTYAADGEVIDYTFEITNTGNVTWPAPPTITDALTPDEACPAGTVAPGASITCSASYTITLDDLDVASIRNTVDATLTVGGVTETGQAVAEITPVITTGLSIEKTLATGPNPITSDTDELTYEYVLTNDGNSRLSTFEVTDDKVTVTCPSVTLDPGQSVTCTSAAYDVLQSDIDAGGVTNTASATAQTALGVNVASTEVMLTVPATQSPALTMSKDTLNPVTPARFTPGEIITYVYTVTNSGNTTITDPVTVTDDKFTDPITCPAGPIAPTLSIDCTAQYEVTLADVAAGSLVNVATASDGNVTSNSDSLAVPQGGTPNITLDKVADTATYNDLTDTIDYTFTITNSGNTTITNLTPVTIDDPLLGGPFTCLGAGEQPVTLAPTETFDCTRTYGPVSQADIDAGQIDNTASAAFTVDGVTYSSPSSSATVVSDVVPALSFVKTGAPLDGNATFDTLGEEIVYGFEVTNDGTQTLASVVVTDPLIPTLSCTVTDLAPGASDSSCSGSYFVTQDDLNAGSILNSASALGTSPTGATETATDDVTLFIDPLAATYVLGLSKTSDVTSFAAVGDVITYLVEVSNLGNLTLEDVLVVDPALGLSCDIGTLAPLASDDTCVGSHVITQDDIDRGFFLNEATARAANAADVTSDVTVAGPVRAPDFTVEKTASADTDVAVGTVVTYDHVVTNTGNVTLDNITLTDTHTSAGGTQDLVFTPSNVIASLAPGASVTLSTSYSITQADIDLGADVTNTVSATSDSPTGTTPPTATDDEFVDLEDIAPAVSVVKTETDGDASFDNLPASETFTFVVTNDGNVTLSGFTLDDPSAGLSCPLADIAPNASVSTCADGSPLSVTYTVTQDDIDRGSLTNTVTVSDGTTTATDEVTLAGPDQLPVISMVKTATSGAGFAAVGDVITYDYVITNDGNITLTAPISVADDKTTVSCPVLPAGGLAPGATLTCMSSYTVVQDDLDDTGEVINIATATALQPVVPSATYPGGTAEIFSGTETETVSATQTPEIRIVKAIAPGTPSTYDAVGDVVTFQFTVTNDGNVTLRDAVTVTDVNIPDTLTCPASGAVDIAPGGSVVCTATWSPAQSDIDAGSFANEATAATTFNGTPVASDPLTPGTATATAIQTPDMEVVKTLNRLEDGAGIQTTVFGPGTVAFYDYTITNTGNVTLEGPMVVNDNLIPTVTCPAGDIAPTDAPMVCTASYAISQDDIDLGSVTNIATALDDNGVESPPTSVTIPGGADPSISLTKAADVSTFTAVGQVITYTYSVTNTSPGTEVSGNLVRPALIEPILVEDDRITGSIDCTPADGVLSPDEVTTCTAPYTVTQADMDAVQSDGAGGLTSGFVTNNAVAETTFGSTDIASPPQTVTVDGVQAPELTVAKDVTAGNDPAAVNDLLEYTITTTNTGNQRVSGITVSDPLIPVLSCSINGAAATSPFTLEAGLSGAGEVLICTGTYTVAQDDIDAQVLSNTATVEGSSPDGTLVQPDPATDTHPLLGDSGALSVVKELTPGSAPTYTDVGQPISFTITVTNDRLITLGGTVVTDTLPDGTTASCTIPGPLAPGASDSSCVFIYETTQADIDAGALTNAVSATSTPVNPGATPVSGEDTLVVDGAAFEPSITLAKSADLASVSEAGEVITYSYVIANTGNVTLVGNPTVGGTPPLLVDDKIPAADLSCPAFPTGGLEPLGSITCTGTYTVTQDDVDAGGVTNVATASVTDTYNSGPDLTDTDSVTVPALRDPAMTVTKEADVTADVAVGDTITYSYTVTNTGNVTLDPVTLSDSHTSAAGTTLLAIENGGVITDLEPDDVVTLTAEYVVTQADIDAGADLTNTVTATPTPPAGVVLAPVTADETVTVEAADPALEVLKTLSSPLPDPIEPGVTVSFDITVENTGNVSLSGLSLTDTLRRADTSVITPAPVPSFVSGDDGVGGTVGTLDVGETWVYTVSHEITQDDMDAGGISNSVLAEATDPFGTPTEDISDDGTGAGSKPTVLPIDPQPGIVGVKTITSSTVAVGETVTYEITIENIGNVTLSGVAVASDTLTRADTTPLTLTSGPDFVSASAASAEGTLQVGETATYTASYVLQQEDIDAGGISNTADVTGTPPTGPAITDTTHDEAGDPALTGDDTTDLVIDALPEISMVKSLFSGGATYSTVGQELVFSFDVTNEGNITLTDPITITDAMITDAGETITCDPTPLAPGDTLNCQGSYFVTQNDIDTGSITNSATAQSNQAPETEEQVVTVNALQETELNMEKVAADMPPEDYFVGAIATYTYTVTNAGNTTILDPITISDNRIDSADIACPAFPAGGIAPGGTYVCEASYVVTVDDNSLGVVTNNATASDGNTTSPTVSETIPNEGIPALHTVKDMIAINGDAGVTEFSAVGDVLTYEFTVANSGNVSFSNDVLVIDPLIAESPITCFTSTPADPDLRAGEFVTCTGTYVITQDDLDAGEVLNEATAQTTFGVGPTIVESPVGTETTEAATDPMIAIEKTVAPLPVLGVDHELTYTLTITNTGNQTLRSVVGTDAMLPGLVCEANELAPGGVLVCSDTYTVTQDDIDSPSIINDASVSAIDPQGDETSADVQLTTPMPASDPAFTLEKSVSPDPFGAVGTTVLYTFKAINDGTTTLFDVTITDDIVDPVYSCSIARLNVGESNNSCTLSYTVQQADVDAGEIVNAANAFATDPFGTRVDAPTATNTVGGPDAEPALEVTKLADIGGTSVGSVISYTLLVENTGNVSLTAPQIVDTMTRNNGRSVSLDAPFAYASGDLDGDGLVGVNEIWTYEATYTLGQADLNAGGLSNSVTATAEAPDGTPAADVSDNGNDTDGNSSDDPTVVPIVVGPAISTEKVVVSGVPAVGDVVTYQITATNTGNVTLITPTITDSITRVDGGPADGATTGPTLISGNVTGIEPGEAWVWEFTYTITQDDVDAGGVINTATAGGVGPMGTVVTDRSDDGDDSDGNLDDDPTQFLILPDPGLTVIKEVDLVGAAAGELVEFTVTVTNDGTVTLTDLVITDTMTNGDGAALTPDSITVSSGSADTLGVGETMSYLVRYTLTQDDVDSGGITNSASVAGTTPSGLQTSDVSDTGSGDGSTPTVAPIPQVDSIAATKEANTPTRIAPNRYEVTFTMTLENLGNVTQTNLILNDDLSGFLAPATLVSVSTPVVSGFANGIANPAYNGIGDIALTNPGASLAPGETGVIVLTVVYDTSNGQPAGENVFSASSDRITTAVSAVASVIAGADPDILASKTVTPDSATVGQTVTYTMTFTNNLATDEANLTLVDAMPAGLVYTPDSATYNGATTPQPAVSGRTLTWSGVTISAGATVTITVQARVTDGGLGDLVNEAYVLDPSGARVSNIATATLRLPVEAVFDCADIIGKVFDDRNMNGYQDRVIEDHGITDQTYYGGKFEDAPAPVMAPEGEPGLPNVRLSTVTGTIITTDQYGRFSVPCAELPGDTGSNFSLKLDTRSLPSGFQLTTENPRVIRVTAGTMARLNFGATIATVVDIDLMDSAFRSGSAEPTQALVQGVDQLITVLEENPSVLRLTYYRASESRELARARLDQIEALIRDRWRNSAGNRLPIERAINWLQ